MRKENLPNNRKASSDNRPFASATAKPSASTQQKAQAKPAAKAAAKPATKPAETKSTSAGKTSTSPKFDTTAMQATPRHESGGTYSFRCTRQQSAQLDAIMEAIVERADKSAPAVTKGSILRGMVLAGALQFVEALEEGDRETLERLFDQYGGAYGGEA